MSEQKQNKTSNVTWHSPAQRIAHFHTAAETNPPQDSTMSTTTQLSALAISKLEQ